MTTPILPLTTVIEVTVTTPGASLQPFQVNNLVFITADTPVVNALGLPTVAAASLVTGDVYQIVTIGTSDFTLVGAAANTVGTFFQATGPASGTGTVCVPSQSQQIAFLNGYYVYTETSQPAIDWGVSSETYNAAVGVFSPSPNITSGSGLLIVYKQVSLSDAFITSINQLQAIAYGGGFIPIAFQPSNTDFLNAGADAVANNYLVFAPTSVQTDVTSGTGLGTLAVDASLENLRVLYYGGTVGNFPAGPAAARLYAAEYASRGMSTDFSGSNTTSTQEFKVLPGILPDPTVSLALYLAAQSSGVDVYALTAAAYLPMIRTSGANGWFDDVYNLIWFKGALQVAAFNALATSSTKIPQTEDGMTAFKRPLRDVCAQAVINGFVAPGLWTSPDRFGDPTIFMNEITRFGYTVYSIPVILQSPADRIARKAPLTQIAIKFAGAIQSASILVNINY